ncbi:MAG: hypothetical protein V3S55_13915 [Nitrospiraceae bacterium]
MGGIVGGIRTALKGAGQRLGILENPDAEFVTKVEAWTTERWGELKNAYIIYHQNVWESILYYVGQFWITWDEGRRIYVPNTPSDQFTPRPRINRFSPSIDAVASNFNTIPEVEGVPKDRIGADEKIRGIADIATRLARWGAAENALSADYKGEDSKAGVASQIFTLNGCVFTIVEPKRVRVGTRNLTDSKPALAFQCPECDTYQQLPPDESPPPQCPTCGGEIEASEYTAQTPRLGEDGTPATEVVYRWMPKVTVGNSLHVFPRPGSNSMESSPYILWAERLTLDKIWEDLKDYFPKDWEPEADSEHPDGFAVTFDHALNYYYTGYASSTTQMKDSALVIKVYVEPGKMKEFPDGLYAVVINKRAIRAEKWKFVEHPLTKLDYLSIPTLFFPRSIAFDLVEVQRELISFDSIIKLHGMTTAADPWIVDKNTEVSEISGRGDKIIYWRSLGPNSHPPHHAGHGALDPAIYRHKQELKEEIENISAAVSVFRGRQEGGVTAARAFERLYAQAEQMFSKPINHWNNGWKETIRKIVKNLQAMMTAGEIEKIVGPNKQQSIKDFKEADLDNVLDYSATTYGLPRTREEKRREMLELFDTGLLNLNDMNVRAKVFELFGDTGMGKNFNLDATRARAENRNIMTMTAQPRFMPMVEDLIVHNEIHKEAIKALDFDSWEVQAQDAMIVHQEDTQMALAEMMEAVATEGMEEEQGAGAGAGDKGKGGGKPSPKKKKSAKTKEAK